MIVASLVGVACGLGLGLRYKAIVLAPAHVPAVLLTLLLVGLDVVAPRLACLNLLCWSLAMQAGYITLVALAVVSTRLASVRAQARRTSHGL